MKRLQQALQSLGLAGLLGIGILFFCLPFYFSALRPLERQVQSERERAERLRPRVALQQVVSDGREGELSRFYALFPSLAQLPRELDRLYRLAEEAKLELLQAEYRLDRGGRGLAAYRITLPVHGGYAEVRTFLAAVLQAIPNGAIQSLRFERGRAEDSQLDAQVQLTLYFRPDSEGGDK